MAAGPDHARPRRRRLAAVAVAAATALSPLALAGSADAARPAGGPFPDVVDLPDGFLPEGIATRGTSAWFGSRADGDIYRADLRTGEGRVISQGPGPGNPSVGLKEAGGLLFVAGGGTGTLRVVDAESGALRATYQLSSGESFVNDVLVLGDDVWVTDSRQAALYRLPISGGLPDASQVQRLPLSGAWVQAPSGVNAANGIAPTPDRRALLVVNSAEAALFRVDPRTGAATRLDVGAPMTNGDGLLLEGRTLYVVQNRLDRVAVVRLDPAGRTGSVQGYLTSPLFEVPTTVAKVGRSLYLPNAQFGSPDQVDFEAVRIDRP